MQSAYGTVEDSVVVAGSNTVRDTNLCPSFPSQVNSSFKKSAFFFKKKLLTLQIYREK